MSLTWIDMNTEQFERKNNSFMLTTSLWRGNPQNGCQCQNIFAILIKDGKIFEFEELSNAPAHVEKKEKQWLNQIVRKVDGNWILKAESEFSDSQWKEVENIRHVQNTADIIDVDGDPKLAYPCFSYDESNWRDDITSESLTDGFYLIMVQHHCWSYGYSYPEGDREFEVALISSIPLDFEGHFDHEL